MRAALETDPSVTLTEFAEKNKILKDEALHKEFGFARFDNGSYMVSMICPMPGITLEQIHWWFWWHAQESIRYKIWFPGEHYGISTARKDRAYFAEKSLPAFRQNTHYSIERIGKLVLPLKIAFVSPEDFGFSPSLMRENDPIDHLRACGRGVRACKPHRDGALTDETAYGMVAHCCVEYRNLVQILPELYQLYH